jgi:hypothetical protein
MKTIPAIIAVIAFLSFNVGAVAGEESAEAPAARVVVQVQKHGALKILSLDIVDPTVSAVHVRRAVRSVRLADHNVGETVTLSVSTASVDDRLNRNRSRPPLLKIPVRRKEPAGIGR